MLLDYIERLRKQPLVQRRRIATSVTIVIVIFLALIWFGSKLIPYFTSSSKIKETTPSTYQKDSGIRAPYEE
ncbi:MAG: hypothetical protein ACJKTH_02330 [Patescibacteria group bacterium UBA2163]